MRCMTLIADAGGAENAARCGAPIHFAHLIVTVLVVFEVHCLPEYRGLIEVFDEVGGIHQGKIGNKGLKEQCRIADTKI